MIDEVWEEKQRQRIEELEKENVRLNKRIDEYKDENRELNKEIADLKYEQAKHKKEMLGINHYAEMQEKIVEKMAHWIYVNEPDRKDYCDDCGEAQKYKCRECIIKYFEGEK